MFFTSGFTPAVAIALGLHTEVGGEAEAMLISAHYDSIQMEGINVGAEAFHPRSI